MFANCFELITMMRLVIEMQKISFKVRFSESCHSIKQK